MKPQNAKRDFFFIVKCCHLVVLWGILPMNLNISFKIITFIDILVYEKAFLILYSFYYNYIFNRNILTVYGNCGDLMYLEQQVTQWNLCYSLCFHTDGIKVRTSSTWRTLVSNLRFGVAVNSLFILISEKGKKAANKHCIFCVRGLRGFFFKVSKFYVPLYENWRVISKFLEAKINNELLIKINK